MKFEGYIDIEQSVEIVTSLFMDPEKIGEYQEGFVKKVLEQGKAGQAGAISKMYYNYGKREMVLTETIITNNLPHSFEAFYHHKHMDNTMHCAFMPLKNGKTRYSVKVHYTRINWVMPKLMAILFPSMYRKPAKKWMENFKHLAETKNN